jgi:hypothetical protein
MVNRQRLGCQYDFRRARTGNLQADDVGRDCLVSPAMPGRIESLSNSSTHGTAQQPTDLTHVFLKREIV